MRLYSFFLNKTFRWLKEFISFLLVQPFFEKCFKNHSCHNINHFRFSVCRWDITPTTIFIHFEKANVSIFFKNVCDKRLHKAILHSIHFNFTGIYNYYCTEFSIEAYKLGRLYFYTLLWWNRNYFGHRFFFLYCTMDLKNFEAMIVGHKWFCTNHQQAIMYILLFHWNNCLHANLVTNIPYFYCPSSVYWSYKRLKFESKKIGNRCFVSF